MLYWVHFSHLDAPDHRDPEQAEKKEDQDGCRFPHLGQYQCLASAELHATPYQLEEGQGVEEEQGIQ